MSAVRLSLPVAHDPVAHASGRSGALTERGPAGRYGAVSKPRKKLGKTSTSLLTASCHQKLPDLVSDQPPPNEEPVDPMKILAQMPPMPVLKTKGLMSNFDRDYGFFLEGFTGDQGGPVHMVTKKPRALETKKTGDLSDFEANYRPSSSRILFGRRFGRREDSPSCNQALQRRLSNAFPGEESKEGDGRSESLERLHQTSTFPAEAAEKSAPGRVSSEKASGDKKAWGQAAIPSAQGDPEAAAKEAELLRQREACESLRMLVFGAVGHEHLPQHERHLIFKQRRGTRDEVAIFTDKWCALDDDNSGDVDLDEFVTYFNKRKVDRLLGMRCVRYLLSKGGNLEEEDPTRGRKVMKMSGSVTREDMMRLLWLEATDEDVLEMDIMFDYFKLLRISMKPPKLLHRKRRQELMNLFYELDRSGTGSVPYWRLSEIGIADDAMIRMLQRKYDNDRNGHFNCEEYLEMLAPLGYRAHEAVRKLVCRDGKSMRFATWSRAEFKFEGWMMEEDYECMREHYSFPEED